MEKSGSSYDNNLRRVFHFLTISVSSLIYGLGPWTWEKTAPVLSIITVSVILMDLIRIHISPLNNLVQRYLSFILRKHEFHTLSGSSWFLLGGIISLALFPKNICVFGFLCLAVGDPLASYVGIAATGGQKIGQKTWYGCWAFFLMTSLVGGLWLLPSYPPHLAFTTAIVGSLGAAITERILLSTVDDNIAIPLVANGLAMLWLNIIVPRVGL